MPSPTPGPTPGPTPLTIWMIEKLGWTFDHRTMTTGLRADWPDDWMDVSEFRPEYNLELAAKVASACRMAISLWPSGDGQASFPPYSQHDTVPFLRWQNPANIALAIVTAAEMMRKRQALEQAERPSPQPPTPEPSMFLADKQLAAAITDRLFAAAPDGDEMYAVVGIDHLPPAAAAKVQDEALHVLSLGTFAWVIEQTIKSARAGAQAIDSKKEKLAEAAAERLGAAAPPGSDPPTAARRERVTCVEDPPFDVLTVFGDPLIQFPDGCRSINDAIVAGRFRLVELLDSVDRLNELGQRVELLDSVDRLNELGQRVEELELPQDRDRLAVAAGAKASAPRPPLCPLCAHAMDPVEGRGWGCPVCPGNEESVPDRPPQQDEGD